MPAKEIMEDYKEGTLHSGKGGPIVKDKKQAKAIQLSYLRKEGKIPKKTAGQAKAPSRKRV